ncbi:ArsR/SmtB family transcription factor [Mobiluncus curtisii]|uniref:Winged helix-turn-helix transcriptional regulator n=1 Tax=Mobiluncus curtisii TaxID=2051 RepID=A0A7Y0UHG2_9ACTO|nr:metalloregulator ArsR/SmtB family transcription factor [Mobiluncus curtisii]MCU9986586.1 winged helix-turn-helix transcriptional regulator [Mobiluncus curtisii]MCV0000301.1 winged helix-turn-helix transcriptional regulator [Mobiluncus curtisii]NMW45777.1 winged helix-turn-helix transcriptional regulator [Mobiluncus curtisii]NMW48872.1 winged helix-turn-helix transcriptional regulator [Mobiluncus curtisii]NMW87323.1 winged helix-turn-helix transcriptional regulator [Mobiluncus curtisii]
MSKLPAAEIRALREILAHPHGTGAGCRCATETELTPHESGKPHASEATHDENQTRHGRPAHPPMQPVDIDEIANTWAPRFELLADLTRLKLLSYMHIYPGSCVQDLANAAGITQTAASQALRVLRDEGWVSADRDGRLMRYTLKDTAAHQMLHFIGHIHV